MFIVHKNSPIRTIKDVRGKTILTPDQYSNIWRVANAMLRDADINMANEKVRSMRDQAAIGWSMENEFFDVGVVNSISGSRPQLGEERPSRHRAQPRAAEHADDRLAAGHRGAVRRRAQRPGGARRQRRRHAWC